MRCPNCAGEIPAGSRFCGICGRNITAPVAQALGREGGWQPTASAGEAQPAMSLFELPVARGARTAKMALVLALDAILAGAGIVMILSYLEARKEEPRKDVRPAGATVEVMAPQAAPEQPVKASPGQKKPPAPKPVEAGSLGGSEETPEEVVSEQMSERLRQLVQSHARELESCHERVARAAGPKDPLAGRIGLQLTVMPDGTARDVRASENTTGSAQLADCVVALFKTWSLPAGAEPIELIWPLQFRPTSP